MKTWRIGWLELILAFITGMALSALIAILAVQTMQRSEAEAIAVQAARSAAISETSDLDELAAQFNVEIVWTDDDRNCGAGCYRRETPNVIYVAPGFSDEVTRHIVLHEIGHVMHHRLGLPPSEEEADRFAASLEWTKAGQ